MVAYIVIIREEATAPDVLARYTPKARAARAGRPMTILSAYEPIDTLEGAATDGVLLLEFPNTSEARAWYDSPEYSEARAERAGSGSYRMFLVPGSDTNG